MLSDSQRNGVRLQTGIAFAHRPDSPSDLAHCFDARTGALAKPTIDTANTHEDFAYTEFVRDRDKLYPRRMRGYERGVLAEEVGMIVLEHPESTPPGAFDPPASAFSIPKGKKFAAPQPEADS